MKTINFYMQGFGFSSLKDYITSTFGFMASLKCVTWSSVVGLLGVFLQNNLGFSLSVFLAFVFLNFLEFFTGIQVAKKKGLRIESRKMGRMLLKVGTYLAIICMLYSFKKELKTPAFLGLEMNPFILLYWGFLAGIIFQLYKSLMENLIDLEWKEIAGTWAFIKKIFKGIFYNKR